MVLLYYFLLVAQLWITIDFEAKNGAFDSVIGYEIIKTG